MHLIRAATLTVRDISHSTSLYQTWLGYELVEQGLISSQKAQSWSATQTTGLPFAVMQPKLGASVYLRFIEQPAPNNYLPLRTYGWAAIEICTRDTLKTFERLKDSPFEIIGPPKELDSMPAIFPMQVKGPDGEIVYLTEIRSNMPDYDLPRAKSLIDQLFILVIACSDMETSAAWMQERLELTKGRSIEIVYNMLNNAFALPSRTRHALATLRHERDVFLEVDQYPDPATPRDTFDGFLPPCVAIGSFIHPNFDHIITKNSDAIIQLPAYLPGRVYAGKRAVTLRAPDNTLIEIIEA